MSDDESVKIGQGFAREQRRRELGRRGCDDCGSRHYRRIGIIGTGAVLVRLCPECAWHRARAKRNTNEPTTVDSGNKTDAERDGFESGNNDRASEEESR